MSLFRDPRFEQCNNENSVYYEKPLHMLSQADKDKIIKRHLRNKQTCQDFIERLEKFEPENAKRAVNRALYICNENDATLCIYLFEKFHQYR